MTLHIKNLQAYRVSISYKSFETKTLCCVQIKTFRDQLLLRACFARTISALLSKAEMTLKVQCRQCQFLPGCPWRCSSLSWWCPWRSWWCRGRSRGPETTRFYFYLIHISKPWVECQLLCIHFQQRWDAIEIFEVKGFEPVNHTLRGQFAFLPCQPSPKCSCIFA